VQYDSRWPAGAVALAGLAVLVDDEVTELGPAPKETPVDDHPAADARAEGEHDHVLRAAASAGRPLCERRRVGVVLDGDGEPQALGGSVAESEVVQRDVDRASDGSALVVDLRRDSEADRDGTLPQVLLNSPDDALEQILLRVDRRGMLAPLFGRAVAGDESGEDLRAAHVDADHSVRIHARRLP